MKYKLILLFAVLLNLVVQAQNRIQHTINSDWQFFKGYTSKASDNVNWEAVTIPHSWNAVDVMDDVPGYYRDTACYKKEIYVPASWQDKDVYLVFDAVGISATIYINGQLAGAHKGAYTSFNVPISEFLRFNDNGNCKNQIFVVANNTFSEDIPPLSADFTFFGGIYRDVHMVAVDKLHFGMDKLNSNGVIWQSPMVNTELAELVLKSAFTNNYDQNVKASVRHIIYDKMGKEVLQSNQKYTASKGEISTIEAQLKVRNPHLWSPEEPYLYRLKSQLIMDGEVVDQIENPLAFRWFEFDAEKGFFLNGSPYKLIGTSRHQDYPGLGNALEDGRHLRDVELLKEMGGNFLRISHYPQDKTIIEACDRLGILTSIEIPLVNRITESKAFFDNSETMLREMMAQYYNHPSLIVWAYMNEILLRPPYDKKSEAWKKYLKATYQLFSGLENIVRENDPYRYTMMVGHGSGNDYKEAGLISIPKVFGWNVYTGWYDGKSSSIGKSMDSKHRLCGDVPILLTEYGADADIRIHSFAAERFDKAVEYATDYHSEYLKAFYERPFINGMLIWNLADFSSETRTETTPHVNAKGLLTLDRLPKDPYRFYQANLLKKPFLKIGSKEWDFRTDLAKEDGDTFVEQEVQVFSNAKEIGLWLNGALLGQADVIQGIATFKVPFVQGENQVLAKSTSNEFTPIDVAIIDVNIIPKQLKNNPFPASGMNISLGDKRFYTDYHNHENWVPAQAYTAGSWGYIGGDVFKMAKSKRQGYGSNKNILDTDLDAIYATQQCGIEAFQFDVPDGSYTLVLHFAELLSDKEHEALAYNLDEGGKIKDEMLERSFDVLVNKQVVINQLSNKEHLVPEKAIAFKINVIVENNQGIKVQFKPLKGKTILNGIQLKKVN